MFSGVGNSTFDRDNAAPRFKPLSFCHAEAENTPVLRTEEPCAPKVRQTSFLPPCTAHSFGCFQKNGGCIRATEGRPYREETKKICSRPMVLGRERTYASWCHPNSRQTVSFGLLLRGGSRGRFRPRSAAVLRLIRTGDFQPCLPLCGSVVRVLLRHLRGDFSTILCDLRTNVKGKTAIRCGNPGRPGQGPAPAFQRWRCCWQRGCCCGRTDGKYSAPRW